MGSTRLPGKVLLDLQGRPVLARCLERLKRAESLARIVVATTTLAMDDVLEKWCVDNGWDCFRGHPEDLLDRYYQAALGVGAGVVVRCTSDCPLIDPALVDRVVGEFLARQPGLDYACNRRPRYTFPRGLDTEVMTMAALARAWREDADPAWREHVTPYIYLSGRFRCHGVMTEPDLSRYRLTVDTPEDLELLRLVYAHFGHDRMAWQEVVAALEQHPDWAAINADIVQKAVPAPRTV
jgi:spore coat polysaccharide biosynthesis protein SpsF